MVGFCTKESGSRSARPVIVFFFFFFFLSVCVGGWGWTMRRGVLRAG